MNYKKFEESYYSIYGFIFREHLLEDTGYEWAYLENEIYALRPIGEKDFVVVSARSPIKAYNKLKELSTKILS